MRLKAARISKGDSSKTKMATGHGGAVPDEPWENCTDFTHFLACLRHQMTDGVDIGRIYNALKQPRWVGFFAAADIELCRKMKVPAAICDAVSNDSPAMFEIVQGLQGKRLGRGIVRYIWTNGFRGGKNAILKHLLVQQPKALCAAISRDNLLALLCSFVSKAVIGKEDFSYFFPFQQLGSMLEVELLKGIEKIHAGAFENCQKLSRIVIPDTVKEINRKAFYNCVGLGSVVIPGSVTKIGDAAFGDCTHLASVILPACLTEINWRVFIRCRVLSSVVIPNGVTRIGLGAFYHCCSLASVVIPEGVTGIQSCAFSECFGLTSIVIPNGVTKIGEKAFAGCAHLESVVLPDSLQTVGLRAFAGCACLKSVVFPKGVREVDAHAFDGCTNLKGRPVMDNDGNWSWEG